MTEATDGMFIGGLTVAILMVIIAFGLPLTLFRKGKNKKD